MIAPQPVGMPGARSSETVRVSPLSSCVVARASRTPSPPNPQGNPFAGTFCLLMRIISWNVNRETEALWHDPKRARDCHLVESEWDLPLPANVKALPLVL